MGVMTFAQNTLHTAKILGSYNLGNLEVTTVKDEVTGCVHKSSLHIQGLFQPNENVKLEFAGNKQMVEIIKPTITEKVYVNRKCNGSTGSVAPSASIFDNHVTDVKNLSSTDSILTKLLESLEWNNLPELLKSNAKLTEAKLISYDYSENLKVINIPLNNSNGSSSLIIYTGIFKQGSLNKFKYLPVKSELSNLNLALRQFKLLSIKGEEYYSFKLNSANKVGEFKIGINLPIRLITPPNNNTNPTDRPSCPDATSSFGACMQCAINECASDWVCGVVCGILAPECMAGFALGCAIF